MKRQGCHLVATEVRAITTLISVDQICKTRLAAVCGAACTGMFDEEEDNDAGVDVVR